SILPCKRRSQDKDDSFFSFLRYSRLKLIRNLRKTNLEHQDYQDSFWHTLKKSFGFETR
ncbi:hypothetical protein X975_14819, partial [Stegodyphus mimosarum]